MERALARHVAVMTFGAGSQLESLIHVLKGHCDETEYKTYLKAIASIIATAHRELLYRVYAAYPDLEAELTDSIQKYGRVL